jgi:hypothetical protein
MRFIIGFALFKAKKSTVKTVLFFVAETLFDNKIDPAV